MKPISLIFFTLVLMFLTLSGLSVPTVTAADGCTIPESGPWPPCATGGNSGGSSSDCVIPERGPWPPCATGGNSGGSSNDCVIPERGPWPPCATGGGVTAPSTGNMVKPTIATQVVHQGRGTKQTSLTVDGLTDSARVAKVEVIVDFTFASATCSVSGKPVDKSVLGYAVISPSGKQVDLIDAGSLTGMQNGARARMHFKDGGSTLQHIAGGTYQSADSLSQLIGENPSGEWKIVMVKKSFEFTICQHSATLLITTR